MAPPKYGIYIIQGEISLVVTAMRRTTRWTTHSHQDVDADPLLSCFSQLKDVLNAIADLEDLEPNAFLSPFLDVIRSEDTTGPITGLSLTSVSKFISYGLIDPLDEAAAPAIENIADAVTHARFVGTDPSSDEVVLMKILHVLRTLLLSPAGVLLTNESVCEIMQSCFRICFEMRLSELLRKSAEHTLMDMVQLLFTRLPQFKEDPKWNASMRKLKMRAGGVDPSRMAKKKRSPKCKQSKHRPLGGSQVVHVEQQLADAAALSVESIASSLDQENTEAALSESPCPQVATPEVGKTVIDITNSFQEALDAETDRAAPAGMSGAELVATDNVERTLQREAAADNSELSESIASTQDMQAAENLQKASSETELNSELSCPSEGGDDLESLQSVTDHHNLALVHDTDFINPHGVRFTPQQQGREGSSPLIPYGLPCVRELFRFLVSLINPLDRHNTEVMIHMGLSLLTVALESGADSIRMFKSLLHLVKDEMCKNLFMLLQSERLSLFTATLRVCFLLFESTRSHLKFQLEMYLMKVSDIIISESPKVSYEMREIALESVVHLWRIPGLVTELFLNYDCDLFCSNIFEDLTKLLSKNAFPVSGLFTTHLLSLDALLTVIDTIEQHCHNRILNSTKHTPSSTTGEQGISGSRSAEEKPDSRCMETDTISRPELIETPPMSGYEVGQRLLQSRDLTAVTGSVVHGKEMRKGPQIRPNRMKVTDRVPTSEELSTLKHKKRLYQTGTEQFNLKPSKGIVFLQEQNLLSTPLDPGEVVTFLKENPKLDKRMIGEYLSSKKNAKFLETFVKSFNFEDTRMDEALRLYLETFRLPGEAPVISYIMEQFSEHWHKTNGEPFTNVDAAFTLAYAVIMLNVDQHNHNVKKQNTPMTVEEFKKNLTKTNGGQDFDNDMLEEVYNAIRGEEIVMPAEHTGLVRENYLWKVLLKRGLAKEGLFIHAPTGSFDHELFTLVWGPTVAALSFVFDKSLDEGIIQKAISGFRKCAMISAHYGMSDVFDNLVISLCKFTTLLSSAETPENIPISFGSNSKAQLAARTVFGLAHRHGDILREGWKNILDCLLQLYRAKLVPKSLIEVEDFADAMGKISIMREETTATHRTESGMLSSFYGFFAIDSANQKGPSQEEQEATKQAHSCIRDCHLEQLIMDSKFLREEALQELVKTLIMGSQTPDVQDSLCTQGEEDAAVFFLELLIRVVLQNRDRVSIIWQAIRGHLYSLLVDAGENTFLVERAVVGLLRIAIRLLRREEIASQVLTSLQMLLMMKPNVIHSISQQVAFGLHDLLRTNAANIHSTHDWYTLFTLLEVVGAGANPPAFLHICTSSNMSESAVDTGAQSDSELPSSSVQSESGERGYTSDSELYDSQSKHHRCHTELEAVPNNGGWVMIDKDIASPSQPVRTTHNQYTIDLNEDIHYCDSKALLKSSETLAFLVRDAVHVTPHNFESCIHTIRTFVEASINGGQQRVQPKAVNSKDKKFHHKIGRSKKDSSRLKKSHSTPNHLHVNGSDEDGDNEVLTAGLHSLSIQLLDLMHTLHTRAASIFSYWAEEGGNNSGAADAIDAGTSSLWVKCWCPLLQGIARLCCDSRRQVRSQALTYLQRALLVHDLQTLSAAEWEACFNKVLFPLLTKLLGNINNLDPSGMEETRVRASTLLCKVFLQHLTPLLSLSTFTALWLTILEFMDKYMHAEGSDLLSEAIPESLKNMLLVMHTAGIFQNDCADSQLWKLSWDRIDTFLPHLRDELFKPQEPEPKKIDRNSVGLEKSVSITMEPDVESTIPFDEQTILTGTSLDTSGSSKSSRPGSPLIEESQSPTSAACILHPPLPNVMAKSSSCQVPTPNTILNTTVPLLLNPDIMQGTTIPFFTPQAIEVCAATLLPTLCLFKCLLQLISDSRDTSTLALSASSSIVRRCSPVRVSSHSLSMEQLSIVTENQ